MQTPEHGVILKLCSTVCSSLAAATGPNFQASLVAEFVSGL